jgi:TatD DNase family protein
MPEYFDTHSHVHFKQFDDDRDEVLARMREKSVWTIAVGTSLETSKEALALAKSESDVVRATTIGIHPTTLEKFDASVFTELLDENVVGVGECGLDYFRGLRDELYLKQKENFEAQIEFAVKNDLPLMLHIRPSIGTEDAHIDALEIIKNFQKTHGEKVRGNTHFFTGTGEVAKQYVDMGFTIAFPGVITFAKETEEAVRAVPLRMILSETDAPYASPVPHRGKRNEPVFVVDTVKKIAEVKGEDLEKVKKTLVYNAIRVFNINTKS